MSTAPRHGTSMQPGWCLMDFSAWEVQTAFPPFPATRPFLHPVVHFSSKTPYQFLLVLTQCREIELWSLRSAKWPPTLISRALISKLSKAKHCGETRQLLREAGAGGGSLLGWFESPLLSLQAWVQGIQPVSGSQNQFSRQNYRDAHWAEGPVEDMRPGDTGPLWKVWRRVSWALGMCPSPRTPTTQKIKK